MGRSSTSDLEAPVRSDVRPGGPGLTGTTARPGLARALLVVAPFALILLAYPFDVPLCPSKHLFGVPCPGCGLTRATVAMATLDFEQMLAMHPLAPVLLPLVVFAIGRTALVAGGWLPPTGGLLARIPRWVWPALVVALLGLWGLRLGGLLGGLPDPVDPAGGLVARTSGVLF